MKLEINNVAKVLYICFMWKKALSFFVKLSILVGLFIACSGTIIAQESEAKKVKRSSTSKTPKKIKNSARASKKRRKQAYKIQDKATRKRMKKAYKNAMRRQKGKKPRNNRLV